MPNVMKFGVGFFVWHHDQVVCGVALVLQVLLWVSIWGIVERMVDLCDRDKYGLYVYIAIGLFVAICLTLDTEMKICDVL